MAKNTKELEDKIKEITDNNEVFSKDEGNSVSHVESIHRESIGVREEMINNVKTFNSQNEINSEKETNERPVTPRVLLVE